MGSLLAYDADCGPCSSFAAVMDLLDARGLIRFASLKEADAAGRLEGVDPALRYQSFHLVEEGRASSGADAVLPLVRLLLPGGKPLSRAIAALPGSRRAISFGYSTLSRLHGAGSCGAAAH